MEEDFEIAKFQLCREVCKMTMAFLKEWGRENATLSLETIDTDAAITPDGHSHKGKIFSCVIDVYDDDEYDDD